MTNFTAMNIITQIIAPSIFGIIVFLGFFGNLLVIIVVIVNKQMRNCTNILIGSLAGADLAFILFCAPLTALIYIKMGWIFGDLPCQLYLYFTYLTAYMSVYTLVWMSVDRFLAVVHPIRSMTLRNEKNASIIVIGTWILFMTCNSPLLLNSGVVYAPTEGNKSKEYYCTYLATVRYNETLNGYEDNMGFWKMYSLLFLTFGFLLPLAVIIILYSFLIMKLLCNQNSRIAQSDKALASKKRVTKMVVIVVIIFVICWSPIQMIFILQIFGSVPETVVFRIFHVLGNALAYSNSMINPILYAFLSTNFRLAFKSILTCQKSTLHGREFEKSQAIDRRKMSEQYKLSNSEPNNLQKNKNINNTFLKKVNEHCVHVGEGVTDGN